MVKLRLETDTPDFFSDICDVIRLFWPDAQVCIDGGGGEALRHRHREADGRFAEAWALGGTTKVHEADAGFAGLEKKRMLKRAVKTGLFDLLRAVTGQCPPWGSLTGIRPTRLMYEAKAAGLEGAAARAWLMDTFYVSEDRARLLEDILRMQSGLIEGAPDEVDVYIGIPFCTTRCAYCSFSSGEVGDGRLIEPYLAALEREMALSARLMRECGYRARACYMGGGTPTVLSAKQLARVMGKARASFPGAREWTVEAGRPDTIDRDKLMALRDAGVGRISVNPQTFSDETLARIGRAHTCRDTLEAYHLARDVGFSCINMDLIAALPGEGLEDFARSLFRAVELAPENITVHTLAIKRSSKLHEAGYCQVGDGVAQDMVDHARRTLGGAGYGPYYLYRQKYMAGNLENVGYAKPGHACLYNIGNMEETARVIAMGAGAITKWLFPRERRIERAPSVKNIEQYILRVDEMFERKRKLIGGGTGT